MTILCIVQVIMPGFLLEREHGKGRSKAEGDAMRQSSVLQRGPPPISKQIASQGRA